MAKSPTSATFKISQGPGAGQVIILSDKEQIIGRAASANLVINHPEVSQRHARIVFQGGSYHLEDLGSSNGTFINGKPIRGSQALIDGDEIFLGPNVKLVFNQRRAGPQSFEEILASKPSVHQEPGIAKTMLDVDAGSLGALPSRPAIPPSFLVTVAGQVPQAYKLTKDRITLGRAEDNDIVVPSQIISRHHAILGLTASGYEIEVLPGATNTLTCQGRPVTDRKLLFHGDVIRVDSEIPGMMVSMAFLAPSQAAAQLSYAVQFGEKEKLTFGRDPANDVVLDMPNVSRFHAQVTRVGRRYCLNDLRSANGTFVNDRRVSGDVWLNPQDTIRISSYRLVMGEDQFTRYDDTAGLQVETYHLNKWVRKDLNLLQDISLIFQPREFIVVVGQSGGGKSTLVDAIAGYRPATHGKVCVNNIDVYQNFDAVRNEIGFVPQRDIIHMELTVYQALDFAAQLRMPKDINREERHKRIMEVLADLDLTHRKDVQVSGLSGGQQKRVSIGVELLTRPGLFFLDEPTSGLDPGTETALMHLMRRLADQGRTIIMVTHATKNVMLADKVVFLARGGYLAWFGPPDEALAYFDQYRSEQERRIRQMEFDQIYAILDDPKQGKAGDWAERFKASAAYVKYIFEPLQGHEKPLPAAAARPVRKAARSGARISSLRQFLVLSLRNLTILRRDRFSLLLMLLTAPAMGALDLILAPAMGRAVFDFTGGNVGNVGTTLFLMTMDSLLVGAMSQMREFVKEADIYKRERLVNLRILPYVTSKVWVALVLALWNALAFTGLHYLAFKMPGGFVDFIQIYITMVLCVGTGMLLGLLASAIAPNAASAPLTTIMFLIPLIVLSGGLAPIPASIGQVSSMRWSFQGLMGITGVGKDVAADACWHLDKGLRDAMDLDDKTYQQCLCMGVQMFDENTCSFPGIGDLYVDEISAPAPAEPASLPDAPAEPDLPPQPSPPSDPSNAQAMAVYMNALGSYQQTAATLQENYRNEMDLYQAQADVNRVEMEQYMEDLAAYNIKRASAVKGAEGIIDNINDKFGWAWVDKDDPAIYGRWLFKTWFAPVKIMVVYFVIILILIKRKDVK